MVPCIIPFDDAGEIDGQKLHRFICWLVEKGVHSLFPFGTFGGGPLLDAKEKHYAAEIIIEAVDGRMHIHDWHATILHLLGLDHEKLTYRHAGRDFRLTDVHGSVAKEILA